MFSEQDTLYCLNTSLEDMAKWGEFIKLLLVKLLKIYMCIIDCNSASVYTEKF